MNKLSPLFNLIVKTNVAKISLQIIETNLTPVNKLHKIFKCNTAKINSKICQKS